MRLHEFLINFLIIMSISFNTFASCGETNENGWQRVDSGYTIRMQVPSGWLVQTLGVGGGVTFVPDRNHVWTLRCA